LILDIFVVYRLILSPNFGLHGEEQRDEKQSIFDYITPTFDLPPVVGAQYILDFTIYLTQFGVMQGFVGVWHRSVDSREGASAALNDQFEGTVHLPI
jgi:hypothetical protein